MKKFFANAGLVIVSLLVALSLGEMLTRLFFKDSIVLFPRYHSSVQYDGFTLRRIRPHLTFTHTSIDGTYVFKTNNKGFRSSQDIEYGRPEDVVRVLCLGDSHTQGYEVDQDETFSSVMERKLRGQGVDAEVLNTGVSGFSTAEEYILLTREGYKYAPQYVVLGFFENDYEDNIKSGLLGLKNGELVVLKHTHTPGARIQSIINGSPTLRYLSEHSYLYSAAANAVWNFCKRMLTRNANEHFAVKVSDVDDAAVALDQKIIEAMYAFCKEHGTTFIIVDIPAVNRDDTLRSAYASSIDRRQLADMKANCDYLLDVDSMSEAYDSVGRVHVPHGHRHISRETHAAIGAALAEIVMQDRRHAFATALGQQPEADAEAGRGRASGRRQLERRPPAQTFLPQ